MSMSRNARIALVAAVAVAAMIAFVLLRPSDDDGSSTTTAARTTTTPAGTTPPSRPAPPPIPVVRVRDAKPVGGIQDITVKRGQRVRFRVTSDVADEVHVHGYDILKDIPAGGSVTFSFVAKIGGVFEVELEQRAEQIAQLKVAP
jgi:hypothetical protein